MKFPKSAAGALLALSTTFGATLVAHAQDQTDPAAAAAAEAPAEAAAEAPAAAEAAPAEAAPTAEVEQAAPAAAEAAPVESAPAASAASLSAKDLPIGTAVFDAEGAKIGEVNRVTAESNGIVTAIHVTTGGKAGLNADAVVVPADKITGAGESVKLSLSATEVKSLPPAG